MTSEWNAAGYARISSLQEVMAHEALALLSLRGDERILDVGCGQGKITAQIAARVPRGKVVGIDASRGMIDYAAAHFDTAAQPNLRFEVADARSLTFDAEFDLVVSFNALHWVPEQDMALQSIHRALRTDGRALLRLVTMGERNTAMNQRVDGEHAVNVEMVVDRQSPFPGHRTVYETKTNFC